MNIEPAVCSICGRDVPWYAKEEHEAICDVTTLDKKIIIRGYKSARSSKATVKPKDNKRLCTICKKPCSPNYYFCPSCQPEDSWLEDT